MDQQIVEETRYAHLRSVRRCAFPAEPGWWDDIEIAPETDRFNEQTIEVGGRTTELINADEVHVRFVEWLLERYASAGLDLPDTAAIWFAPSLDCPQGGSFARQSDERFEQRHTVTMCFDRRGLLGGDIDGTWSRTAVRYGLHELAHVWMYDHLDDDTREGLLERAGLEVWRGDRMWGELGVEHAAETIAWGVAGSEAAQYDIQPTPSCTELAARFELLTGRTPTTSCATWSPR